MKRIDLIRHLEQWGCTLHREGAKHTVYVNRDPFEIDNLNRSRALAPVREKLRRELRKLVAEAVGL